MMNKGDQLKGNDKLAAFYKISYTILDLRDTRLIKKITQEQLAKKMGTKQEAISRFENYETQPTIDFIMKYAQALGEDVVLRLKTDLVVELPDQYKEKLKKLKSIKGDNLNLYLTQRLMNFIDYDLEGEKYDYQTHTFSSTKASSENVKYKPVYTKK